LRGGGGSDRFYFDTSPNGSTNHDRISDFSVAADTVYLARSVFSALPLGSLASGTFRIGTAAGDASDRIVYDKGTGNIYYDPDGTGAAAKILFASVAAGTALTSADFVIYG
jgi:Ca2+-binding RTX toxin-like protein